jgi:hypothetical protein
VVIFIMTIEGARTVLILRRMKRKSLSIWSWPYDPTRARPEELKFDLLDCNGKRIGEIACTSFELKLMSPTKVSMMTPWGEAGIGLDKGGPRITLNGRELAQLKGSLLKRGMELSFPNGVEMSFAPLKGKRNDVRFSDANGSIGGYEENGTLPENEPSRSIQMTPDEIKRLPKGERPHSIETRDFVQYRISSSGVLPVKEEDVVRTLCIFASFGILMDEIPRSG